MIYEIETTSAFEKWLKKLRDRKAVLAVAARLDRAKLGNFGDVKSVGNEINEMRLFVGPGYRLYTSFGMGELSSCSVAETSRRRREI